MWNLPSKLSWKECYNPKQYHIYLSCEIPNDLSSIEDVMGCGGKLPLCKPKVGVYDILNQWEFKDYEEPWHTGFCVTCS